MARQVTTYQYPPYTATLEYDDDIASSSFSGGGNF